MAGVLGRGRAVSVEGVEDESDAGRLLVLRRVVFYGQWFFALLTPPILFAGRTWLGAPQGWLAGFGLVMLAPPVFLALGAPALLIAADRDSYRSRTVSRPYALASLVLWASLMVLVVTVSDPGDPTSSLAVIWTRAAISADSAAQLALTSGAVAFGAWLVATGFAVGSLIEARRRRPD